MIRLREPLAFGDETESIVDGTPRLVPGEEGVLGVRLANAVHHSSRTGRESPLDIDEDAFVERNERARARGRYRPGREARSGVGRERRPTATGRGGMWQHGRQPPRAEKSATLSSEDAPDPIDATAEEAPPAPSAASAPRRGRAATTIYDVAKLAGVAPSTVSRALSKPGRINIKTEQRIHAAAKELNYRLNPMARALPTGRTSTLGLLLADITNPMFFPAVRGAERAASDRGYTMILAESQESGEREAEAADRIAASTDGLILVSTRLADAQIVGLAARVPIVVINREVEGVDGIVPDLAPGIEAALDHLASLGHRSIAFVAGPANSWMSGARWDLLLDRAPFRGMSVVEIGPGVATLDGGRDALARVLAAGVDAVIAYNDLVAIGLMRAAQEAGHAVPGRLSIIGFDDIFGSDFTSPPLTTIRTPLGRMGEWAVRRLLGDTSTPESSDDLPTEFVLRGSTGPRRDS